MKTLTEFSGFVLRDAVAKKAALLAEGKTEEEAQAAINEQLKLDESKATFYKNALDMTSSRLERVKRVVVAVRATETEKAPETFVEREGHFYFLEYFPQANAGGRSVGREESFGNDRGRGGNNRGRGGGRGDSRGGGRGDSRGEGRGPGRGEGGGRGDGGRGRGDGQARVENNSGITTNDGVNFIPRTSGGPSAPREPRAPRPQPAPNPNAASFVSTGTGTLAPRAEKPAGERRPRPAKNNQPRAPRAGGENRGPKGAGELRLVLKGQSATTLQGSGTTEAAPAVSPEAAPQSQT